MAYLLRYMLSTSTQSLMHPITANKTLSRCGFIWPLLWPKDDRTRDTSGGLKSTCCLILLRSLPAWHYMTGPKWAKLAYSTRDCGRCPNWSQANYQKCKVLPQMKTAANCKTCEWSHPITQPWPSQSWAKGSPANPQNCEKHFVLSH